jgi:hypothetical protein
MGRKVSPRCPLPGAVALGILRRPIANEQPDTT